MEGQTKFQRSMHRFLNKHAGEKLVDVVKNAKSKQSSGLVHSKSKALSKGSIDHKEVKGIRKALTKAMQD